MAPSLSPSNSSNEGLIIEGVVTSLNDDESINVSPMGPRFHVTRNVLILRPFKSSHTFENLMRNNRCVFHVTDDVLLIAKAAIGVLDPPPKMVPISGQGAWRLEDTCRWYLLELTDADLAQDRANLTMDIIGQGNVRDFLGFNRARHAVIEGAILATRLTLLSKIEISDQMATLRTWVQKTGGPKESEAMDLLWEHMQRHWSPSGSRPENRNEIISKS